MGKQLEPTHKISHLGLAYGDEFLYIAKENAKLKAAKRRAERKQEREASGGSKQRSDNLSEGVSTAQSDNYYDEDDDDYGGGFDFGGGADDFDDDDENNAGGNTGMRTLDDAFENPGDGGKSFEEVFNLYIWLADFKVSYCLPLNSFFAVI
jgi:condensin-2 complex subunit H2